MLTAIIAHHLFGQVFEVRIFDHKKLDRLTLLVANFTNGRALHDARACGGFRFDFAGVNIEATDQNHVFFAVNQARLTLCILSAKVAGA